MTGMDLRLRRTEARIRANELARQMGVSDARVSQIEALAVVTDESAQRYLVALQSLLATKHASASAEGVSA